MADSSLHFALGYGFGTALSIAPLLKRLKPPRRLSGAALRWIGISFGLGVFAIVPNLLRRTGVPEPVCSGAWTVVFFLHPLVDRLESGGRLIGQMGILSCFAAQYILLLAAIRLRIKAPDGVED
jgi:hypothetical protein